MGGVDYSSFYKFVASLGLLLLVAGLVFPITVLGIASPAPTCESEACLAREALQLFLYEYWWLVTGAALATGSILMFYGMSKWNARQKGLDRKEDAEIAKAIGVEEMSAREVDAKTRREVTEMDAGDPTPATTPKEAESGKPDTGDGRRVGVQDSPAARHARYVEVESDVVRAFAEVMSRRGRVVQANTRIVFEGKTLTEVDALALSVGGKRQTFALEVKYSRYPEKNWRSILERIMALSIHLRKIGNAVPILVLVYDDATERSMARMRQTYTTIIDFPCATVLCRRESLVDTVTELLKSLPDEVEAPMLLPR